MAAIAVAAMAVSCNKPEVGTDVADSNVKKTVSIVIENMVAPPAANSRGVGFDEFTVDATLIAKAADLTAHFTDADGDIIQSIALSTAVAATPGTIEPGDLVQGAIVMVGADSVYTYTFHQLDADVEKVFITNLTVTGAATQAAVKAAVGSMSDWQNKALNALPVWGEATIDKDAYEEHTEGGITYKFYHAGEVDITPMLARIEIGNIQCSDLDGTYDAALGNRYGTLTLGAIGIHDTYNTIADFENLAVDPFTFTPEAGDTAEDIAAQEAEWIALTDVWYKNAISGDDVTLDSATDYFLPYTIENEAGVEDDELAGGGFAYHVVPGAVPNIILQVTGATFSKSYLAEFAEGTVPSAPDMPRYVKTSALGTTTINAGTIYQVNYTFPSVNIKPWYADPEFVCVDLKVVIPKWKISGPLTPTFE